MRKKERFEKVIAWFQENMPIAETELQYTNPYELLVAVILSAQCTDKRVNMMTPALFEQYPTAFDLSHAKQEDIFNFIRSCSYPNNKAKHLLGMAKMLVEDFKEKVPDDIKELQKMPGVGRKTANVIASVVYDKPAMAVDTHVFRVSHRLGLSDGKTVEITEADLVKKLKGDLHIFHQAMVLFGRYTCKAIKPDCDNCLFPHVCKTTKSFKPT